MRRSLGGRTLNGRHCARHPHHVTTLPLVAPADNGARLAQRRVPRRSVLAALRRHRCGVPTARCPAVITQPENSFGGDEDDGLPNTSLRVWAFRGAMLVAVADTTQHRIGVAAFGVAGTAKPFSAVVACIARAFYYSMCTGAILRAFWAANPKPSNFLNDAYAGKTFLPTAHLPSVVLFCVLC